MTITDAVAIDRRSAAIITDCGCVAAIVADGSCAAAKVMSNCCAVAIVACGGRTTRLSNKCRSYNDYRNSQQLYNKPWS